MAETRESGLLGELMQLKNELTELRFSLKEKQEMVGIMRELPTGAQSTSTRNELKSALKIFTKAFEKHLQPHLSKQNVYAPAFWRASMEHLRMLASADMSGSEDVAFDTSERFDASIVLTYDPPENREDNPFGFEFVMEFQSNTEFHDAWTALLTAVAQHTQVLLMLYDPSNVDDWAFARHFSIRRRELEREVLDISGQIVALKEKIVRATGKIVHARPVELRQASMARMRACLRRL
jgi:hypothetical protein